MAVFNYCCLFIPLLTALILKNTESYRNKPCKTQNIVAACTAFIFIWQLLISVEAAANIVYNALKMYYSAGFIEYAMMTVFIMVWAAAFQFIYFSLCCKEKPTSAPFFLTGITTVLYAISLYSIIRFYNDIGAYLYSYLLSTACLWLFLFLFYRKLFGKDAAPAVQHPSETSDISEKPLPKSEPEIINAQGNSTVVPVAFCRKCGAKLMGVSEFCHKCGTAVVR